MTNSNMVGCSTGRSAGWAPFRILSTQLSSSLELRSFMLGCDPHSLDWMKASSLKATNFPANGR